MTPGARRALDVFAVEALPETIARAEDDARLRQRARDDIQRTRSARRSAEAQGSAPLTDTGLPPPLAAMLALAVPLWIERAHTLSPAEFETRRAACVELIAHDNIACLADSTRMAAAKRSRRADQGPGPVAKAFNAVAEGIALLAFQKGGVTWCGLHFEAVRP